jgi:hypothetical protein
VLGGTRVSSWKRNARRMIMKRTSESDVHDEISTRKMLMIMVPAYINKRERLGVMDNNLQKLSDKQKVVLWESTYNLFAELP